MSRERLIIKKRVRRIAEQRNIKSTTDDEYADLMMEIEGQVQTVLEESGHLEF